MERCSVHVSAPSLCRTRLKPRDTAARCAVPGKGGTATFTRTSGAPPLPKPSAKPTRDAKSHLSRDPIKEESRKYRRTVFDFDYWANHRSSSRYWRHLSSAVVSHVVRCLAVPVSGVTAVACLVVLYHMAYDHAFLPAWAPTLDLTSPIPLSLTASALSLLLVFRTNVSYQRFDEARKMWGLLLNRSRDLVRQATTFFPEDDVVGKAELGRWTAVAAKALMCHVREDSVLRTECAHLLEPDEVDWLMQSDHRVLAALQVLSQIIEWSDINAFQRQQMQANITAFEDILGGCERLLRTPVPLTYTRHTSRFMLIWLMLLPLHLYGVMGYGVVPCTAIVAYLVLGIEEIGVDIEEPFGILPLEVISSRVEIDCKAILRDHLLWRQGLTSCAEEGRQLNGSLYDYKRIRSDYRALSGRDLRLEYQKTRLEASYAFMGKSVAAHHGNAQSIEPENNSIRPTIHGQEDIAGVAGIESFAQTEGEQAARKQPGSRGPLDANMDWLGLRSADQWQGPAVEQAGAPTRDSGVYVPGPEWPRNSSRPEQLPSRLVVRDGPAHIQSSSLSQYVFKQAGKDKQELAEVMEAVSKACKEVRRVLIKARGIEALTRPAVDAVFRRHLRECPYVHAISSPGCESFVSATPFGKYLVVIDGLRRADASNSNPRAGLPHTCTFAIYPKHAAGLPSSGREIVAAGCGLYSLDHSTAPDQVVFSCGHGTHLFQLAQHDAHYRLTKQDLHLRAHGTRALFDTPRFSDPAWPDGLTQYLHIVASGLGDSGCAYEVEEHGGLTANLTRLLVVGGVVGVPFKEVDLLYTALPLAFLVQHAHGVATDGSAIILDRLLASEHELVAFYAGGVADMMELHKHVRAYDATAEVPCPAPQ